MLFKNLKAVSKRSIFKVKSYKPKTKAYHTAFQLYFWPIGALWKNLKVIRAYFENLGFIMSFLDYFPEENGKYTLQIWVNYVKIFF